MNAPAVAYYLLTWCDAFKCRTHEFRFVHYDDCARLAEHLADKWQATVWCNPVALSPF